MNRLKVKESQRIFFHGAIGKINELAWKRVSQENNLKRYESKGSIRGIDPITGQILRGQVNFVFQRRIQKKEYWIQ